MRGVRYRQGALTMHSDAAGKRVMRQRRDAVRDVLRRNVKY